jgi:hypothetical protein
MFPKRRHFIFTRRGTTQKKIIFDQDYLLHEKVVPLSRLTTASYCAVSDLLPNYLRFMVDEVTLEYVSLQESSAFPY